MQIYLREDQGERIRKCVCLCTMYDLDYSAPEARGGENCRRRKAVWPKAVAFAPQGRKLVGRL